jgi:NAD(P)-dependent dehydrogenase (short-subunit alcohol dehydrogenase family)
MQRRMPEANKRIVLITGATSGLGAEMARQLAQQGCTVVLTGREAAATDASAEAIRAEGRDVHPLRLDVNDADSVREAMREIEQRWGRLDVLINNAGVMLDGRWGQNTTPTISEELLHETFETNFFAVVRVTRAALPLLRRGSSPQVSHGGSRSAADRRSGHLGRPDADGKVSTARGRTPVVKLANSSVRIDGPEA